MCLLHLCLLQRNFGAKLLQELVGLLKNFHDPRIFLRVDHVDVGVKIIAPDCIHGCLFLRLLLFLILVLFLDEMSLGLVRNLLYSVSSFLMKLNEIFLVVEDFFEEFFSACSSAHFLAKAHLLLEAIKSAGFFLAVSENALSFVEITINELIFKQVVTMALTHHL